MNVNGKPIRSRWIADAKGLVLIGEICSWTATETARAIANQVVSVREVTQAHIDRIEAVNPELNAIVEGDPSAMDQARALDALEPDRRGPFFGLPYSSKINTDVEGFASSNGLPGFAENVAPEDAPVISNLRAAGGVHIGRTNTPEFSLRWCTDNPLFGPTKNPWNPELTPGGSSGGAASAVAAGIGVVAQGNDLGGSIRYPAYACGITGLRTSAGRIPAFNATLVGERPPVSQTISIQGPLARTVGDLELVLNPMSGRDARDPHWNAARTSGRIRAGNITIGVARDSFSTGADKAIITAMDRAELAANDAGFSVREIDLPEANLAATTWGQIVSTETRVLLREALSKYGSSDLYKMLSAHSDYFGTLDLRDYMHAMQTRTRIMREWSKMFDKVDLVLMPVSLSPPFAAGMDVADSPSVPSMIEAQKPLLAISFLGFPALALPTHLDHGSPLGVQLIGPMHDDAFTLHCGSLLEKELGTIIGDCPLSA